MYTCVCVCACVYVVVSPKQSSRVCVRDITFENRYRGENLFVTNIWYVCVCVYLCVCLYVYACACVCMCVLQERKEHSKVSAAIVQSKKKSLKHTESWIVVDSTSPTDTQTHTHTHAHTHTHTHTQTHTHTTSGSHFFCSVLIFILFYAYLLMFVCYY